MAVKKNNRKGQGGYSHNKKTGMHEFSCERPRHPLTGARQSRLKVRGMDYDSTLLRFQKAQTELRNGVDPTKSDKTTLHGWLDYWLESIVRQTRKPKTFISYEGSVRKHIKPCFSDRLKLKDLTPEHIRQMIIVINSKYENGSTHSAKKAHQVLSTAMTAAMKDEKVFRNVVQLVDQPRADGNVEAFTIGEVKKILMYCLKNRPEQVARWSSAFFLGARQSECIGIQVPNVDFARAQMNLASQLQSLTKEHGCTELPEKWEDTGKPKWSCGRKRGYACPQAKWNLAPGMKNEFVHGSMVLTEPKSKSGIRAIPISDPLLKAYEAHMAMYYRPNKWNLMFTELGPDGDVRPLTTTHDQDNWESLLKGAGVRHLGMHSCRHTTASLLANANVPIEMIMAIIGHSGVLTTEGYIHRDSEVKHQAMNNVFANMFGDMDFGDEQGAIGA